MLIKFVVDPVGMDMKWLDAPLRNGAHRSLTRFWKQNGVLALAEDDVAQSELSRCIDQLPPDARRCWQEALTHEDHFRVVKNETYAAVLTSAETRDQACQVPKQAVDLLCADPVRAVDLGVQVEQASVLLENEVEVVRIDCVGEAKRVRDARELASKPVESGERVLDVWRSRFERLAAYSNQVCVVERYALQNYANNRESSGLLRVLNNLLGHPRLKKVSIFVADRSELNAHALPGMEETAIELLERCKPGPATIEVVLVSDKDFGCIKHDRYLRFDQSVCALGTGLETLTGERLWRGTEFALREFQNADRECENLLRRRAVAFFDRYSNARRAAIRQAQHAPWKRPPAAL